MFSLRLQCSINKASLVNTHNTIFNVKGNHLKLSKICNYGIFPRAQVRVRNSHEKQAISVRAIEVLLFNHAQSDFLRQANNTQEENDCQTSDMYNNGTCHVSGPGPFRWQARAVHVSGPAPQTS